MTVPTSRRGRLGASVAAATLLAGVLAGTAGCGVEDPAAGAQQPPAAVSTAASPARTPSATPGAVHGGRSGATPTSATPTPSAAPAPKPAVRKAAATVGPILAASVPVTLDVPSIDVHTSLLQLGQAANGEADVPPGEPGSPAGWYKYSPSPGQLGPSVILGHVNSTLSPVGVFYRLHELKPGQQFSVTRSDGKVAVFQVDRSSVFDKDSFPTLAVYGNTNRAEIRLITCGGYDPATGEYTQNTVVYGHLVGSH